eukprot:COSAG01_NODE_4209_length_5240_cov_1.801595_2_plen_212_part_00
MEISLQPKRGVQHFFKPVKSPTAQHVPPSATLSSSSAIAATDARQDCPIAVRSEGQPSSHAASGRRATDRLEPRGSPEKVLVEQSSPPQQHSAPPGGLAPRESESTQGAAQRPGGRSQHVLLWLCGPDTWLPSPSAATFCVPTRRTVPSQSLRQALTLGRAAAAAASADEQSHQHEVWRMDKRISRQHIKLWGEQMAAAYAPPDACCRDVA